MLDQSVRLGRATRQKAARRDLDEDAADGTTPGRGPRAASPAADAHDLAKCIRRPSCCRPRLASSTSLTQLNIALALPRAHAAVQFICGGEMHTASLEHLFMAEVRELKLTAEVRALEQLQPLLYERSWALTAAPAAATARRLARRRGTRVRAAALEALKKLPSSSPPPLGRCHGGVGRPARDSRAAALTELARRRAARGLAGSVGAAGRSERARRPNVQCELPTWVPSTAAGREERERGGGQTGEGAGRAARFCRATRCRRAPRSWPPSASAEEVAQLLAPFGGKAASVADPHDEDYGGWRRRRRRWEQFRLCELCRPLAATRRGRCRRPHVLTW